MKIQPHSRLVMIGDSITAAGRIGTGQPAFGEDLGQGYVALVDSLLATSYPEHGIRIANAGISGNTVRDLQGRWQRDVVQLKPDWLSIMIGINDVWRHFDSPDHPEWHVDLPSFADCLEELISASRPRLKGLVLMTPYLIEPDRADPMRAMMDQYGAVVLSLAERYQAVPVKLQAEFDILLAGRTAATLADDRIHPNLSGHLAIARAFLKAVDFRL